MDLPINPVDPRIMYIDMNSCFATIYQQGHVALRDKPLVIVAYDSPRGMILSPSIEAKKVGIKMGMSLQDARDIYPAVISRLSDVEMIRDVHDKFMKIFSDYSPLVLAKSIDEAVIDFTDLENIYQKDLLEVGQEIKNRMKSEIGEYIKYSIGIGPNRWLAKTASDLKKPDGLEMIDSKNLVNVLSRLTLRDLCGINVATEKRLNSYGIFTPLRLFETDETTLRKKVFKSVLGTHWYKRLRGWEVDDRESVRKSYGQQYALSRPTNNIDEILKIIMQLTEKMGRRLRESKMAACGIGLGIMYKDYAYGGKTRRLSEKLFTTIELFTEIKKIFNEINTDKIVRLISISCFALSSKDIYQEKLFGDNNIKMTKALLAVDRLNDKYGEYTVTSALSKDMDKIILDRIAFGKTS
jgi:DNA polymerase-4